MKIVKRVKFCSVIEILILNNANNIFSWISQKYKEDYQFCANLLFFNISNIFFVFVLLNHLGVSRANCSHITYLSLGSDGVR